MDQSLHCPCFFSCLSDGLQKNLYRSVHYTAMKCLNNFFQSAVNARREGDENPDSSVMPETMTILANSSYDYQNSDWIRHTVKKHLSVEKTHGVINKKFVRHVHFINDQLFEVGLVRSEIDLKEPNTFGFFSAKSKIENARAVL